MGIPCSRLSLHYILQCLVDRLSSTGGNKIVLKGGFLLTQYYGIPNRTTKDLDISISDDSITEELCIDILEEAFSLDSDDFEFKILKMQKSKSKKGFGLTVNVLAKYGSMETQVSIDIVQLVWNPERVEVEIRNILSDEVITILSYSIESEMAEKIHAVLSNYQRLTRFKDVYDIWYYNNHFEVDGLRMNIALQGTFNAYSDVHLLNSSHGILEQMKSMERLITGWIRWLSKPSSYAVKISWPDACTNVQDVLTKAGFR